MLPDNYPLSEVDPMKKIVRFLVVATIIIAGAQFLRRHQKRPLVLPTEKQTLRDALKDDKAGKDVPHISNKAEPAQRAISAIYNDDLDTLKTILNEGFNPDTHIQSNDVFGLHEETLLMRAATDCHTEIAQFLIERGANVNEKMHGEMSSGQTALWEAVRSHKESCLPLTKILLDHHADPNDMGEPGSALWVAAYSPEWKKWLEKVTKMLLEYGADPNQPNGKGEILLVEYTRLGRLELIKLLLDYKADPLKRSSSGETALDLARSYLNRELQYINPRDSEITNLQAIIQLMEQHTTSQTAERR